MVRKVVLSLMLVGALAFAQSEKSAAKKMGGEHMNKGKEVKAMAAGDLQWGPPPPGLPSDAQMVVLEGNPMAAENFIVRLKAPDGYNIYPHWHPTAENVTVISGQAEIGSGKDESTGKTTKMGQGDFISLPAHHPHYFISKGESIIQVQAMGPFQITYFDAKHDPRKGETKKQTSKK